MNTLMLRPGKALGDACFVSFIPKLIAKQGHTVDVMCEPKVRPVFQNNPYIREFIDIPKGDKADEEFNTTKESYDHVYHAHGHVEVGLMYRSDARWGSIPTAHERRKRAVGKSFQQAILKGIGLKHKARLPEFYFDKGEEKGMKEARQRLDADGKKLVLWQWNGSTQSKVLVHGPEYLKWTMEKFPNSIHYVYCQYWDLRAQIPKDRRVLDAMDNTSIRNSIRLAKIADLVIGPESFLPCAAGAFDTPKIIFFSHSAPENWAGLYKNCYPILPNKEVTCSPCYMLQINFQGVFDPYLRGIAREFEQNCRVWNPEFLYESLGAKCCYHLPHEQVKETIAKVLSEDHRRDS